MRYVLLFSLFLVGCKSNPKFNFGELVKINGGFFSGESGVVVGYLDGFPLTCSLYEVQLISTITNKTGTFCEENLEKK